MGNLDERKEVRVLQLQEQVNNLNDEISFLSEKIEELTGRLNGVLRPSSLSDGKIESAEKELVPLASSIWTNTVLVCNAKNKIEDILSRLEL